MICLPVLIWLGFVGFFFGEGAQMQSLSIKDGEVIRIQGTVDHLESSDSGQTVRLNNISILSENSSPSEKLPKKIKILVYLKNQVQLHIGNQVQVEGICACFATAENPGSFDAKSYYSANGIAFAVRKASILKRDDRINWGTELLHRIRCFCRQMIVRAAPENTAAILCAMILGEKGDLPSDIKALFQNGGIIHILAISGLHISILGMGLYNLLRKLGRSFLGASFLSGMLMVAFGTMTGFAPSAKRAVIMFVIYLGAQVTGRTYDMPNALMTAAILILFENPMLITQAGFLLSFFAVLGVLTADVWNYNWMKKTGLSVSISTWLFTLPLVAWFYYRVPVYGIFLNLVVIPFMTPVMLSGLAGMAAGIFSVNAGRFCMAPAHYILEGIQKICGILEVLPGGTWTIGRPLPIQIIIYYLFLLSFCLFFRKKRKIDLIQKAFGIILIISVISIKKPQDWTMTFLNVGQGDGICIRTVQDDVWLVDGGSLDRQSLAQYTLEPYLESKGICKIDGWIVSHFDQDHVSGLLEILENYQCDLAGKNKSGITIEQIILPDMQRKEEGTIQEQIKSLARKNGILIKEVSTGMIFQKGKTSICVLAPQKDVLYEDQNQGSMVVEVRYQNFRALLTGDVEKEGEAVLTKQPILHKIDLLKVAHHGSKNGSCEEFLQKVQPEAAVISCGKENRYGHPHKEVLQRLKAMNCRILRTDEDGAVDVVVKDNGWYIRKAQ